MTHPPDHKPEWSNPVDELGGRRVCRVPGCGYIGTREELKALRLADLHARDREAGRAGRIARRRRRLAAN